MSGAMMEKVRQRIVIHTSDYPGECPLEWNGAAALGYEFGWHNRQREYGNAELSGDMAEFVGTVGEWVDGEDAILDALEMHYTRLGYAVERRNWRGYVQSDYMNYVAVCPGEYDAPHCDEFEAWLQGDVYSVHLEQRVTWTSSDNRIKYDWEIVDSLGGCYLGDDVEQGAIDIVRENFNTVDDNAGGALEVVREW